MTKRGSEDDSGGGGGLDDGISYGKGKEDGESENLEPAEDQANHSEHMNCGEHDGRSTADKMM